MKRCNQCELDLPASAFYKRPGGKLRTYCKPCECERSRWSYQKTRKPKYAEIRRASFEARTKRTPMLTADIRVNGTRVRRLVICNVTGLAPISDYVVTLYGRDGQTVIADGTVRGWDRAGPAHELVRLALEAVREKGDGS